MYDRAWARSVYGTYVKLCTRAQQIDLCILQTIAAQTGRKFATAPLRRALVDSIQGARQKSLWPLYKRLSKKTPLDQELLERVSRLAYPCMLDEYRQLELDLQS